MASASLPSSRFLGLFVVAVLVSGGSALGSDTTATGIDQEPGLLAHQDIFPPGFPVERSSGDDEPFCVTARGDRVPALRTCGMAAPVCVRNPQIQHHARLFYVQTEGDADEYDRVAPALRTTLYRVGDWVRDEAMAFWNTDVRFKVLCDPDGRPNVTHVLMPRGADAVAVLGEQGHTSSNSRAWMVEPHGGAWGSIPSDTSPGIDNRNNARWAWARVPDVGDVHEGVAFNDAVFLHEITHSLGTVHGTAPHWNPGGHCNDGPDVMCYPSIASGSESLPCTGGCKPAKLLGDVLDYWGYVPFTPGCTNHPHYDCNHDDYFNLDPAPGSYLDTHWNLGSPNNLFFKFSSKADPVASFNGPAKALVGTTVTFDAGASADPDGTVEWYEWDFGDGGRSGPLRSPTVDHTYLTAGDHRVTLTVYDDYEGDNVTTRSIHVVDAVVDANEPPVAVVEAPRTALLGTQVTFGGASSHDPDGTIVGWRWDFGDGTTASGPVVEHAFSGLGEHDVRLTVMDDLGAPGTVVFTHATTGPP